MSHLLWLNRIGCLDPSATAAPPQEPSAPHPSTRSRASRPEAAVVTPQRSLVHNGSHVLFLFFFSALSSASTAHPLVTSFLLSGSSVRPARPHTLRPGLYLSYDCIPCPQLSMSNRRLCSGKWLLKVGSESVILSMAGFRVGTFSLKNILFG